MNISTHPTTIERRAARGLGYWALILDGGFLICAGASAMIFEFLGHFFAAGPLAAQFGSPYTVGGFEAHGLACLLGILLIRAASTAERRPAHLLALSVHLFLGTCNLLFWNSFVQLGLLPLGIITTTAHAIFSLAQLACLTRTRPH